VFHHFKNLFYHFIAELFLSVSYTVLMQTPSSPASVSDCVPWQSPSTPANLGPHKESLTGWPQEGHPVQPVPLEIHSLWSQTYVKYNTKLQFFSFKLKHYINTFICLLPRVHWAFLLDMLLFWKGESCDCSTISHTLFKVLLNNITKAISQ